MNTTTSPAAERDTPFPMELVTAAVAHLTEAVDLLALAATELPRGTAPHRRDHLKRAAHLADVAASSLSLLT